MSLYNIDCPHNHGYPNSVFFSARISRNRFSDIKKRARNVITGAAALVPTAAAPDSTASAVSTDSDVFLIQHLLIWHQEDWICRSLEP